MKEIRGGECVTGARFRQSNQEDTYLNVDAVIALIGFKPDLADFGLGSGVRKHPSRSING
jgi:thioredoxin reductase